MELKFAQEMFVSAVSVFEVYAMGSLVSIATTSSYVDDNNVACHPFSDDPAEACSQNTQWDTVWSRAAGEPIAPLKVRRMRAPAATDHIRA